VNGSAETSRRALLERAACTFGEGQSGSIVAARDPEAKEILMKRLLASIVQFGDRARIGGYLPGILPLIPTLAMLGMTGAQGHSGSDTSDEWRQQVHEALRDTEKSFAQFRAMRQEAQRLREQERARIPDYTAALAKATSTLSEAPHGLTSPLHQPPNLPQARQGNPNTYQEDRTNPRLMA
jgi:hypothetical protein